MTHDITTQVESTELLEITIPACEEHKGHDSMTITVPWVCLKCGGPRGEPYKTLSFDGSRRLVVDGWHNPCGHVESYTSVRENYMGNQGAEATNSMCGACGQNGSSNCGALNCPHSA